MSTIWKWAIVVALVAAAAVILARKPGGDGATAGAPDAAAGADRPSVPRLVDIGSDSCIPCKMMVPVLEDLRREYAGRMKVEFFDFFKDASAESYEVSVIPTQIFFDATGKELHRHEGFISKEDILATWKQLGVEFAPAATRG